MAAYKSKKLSVDYKFLLDKYYEVNEYIGKSEPDYNQLPQIVISFCIVVERLIKIKLYKKNSLLPYCLEQFKDSANPVNLVGVVNKKESGLSTLKLAEAIRLYRLIFKRGLTDAEELVFLDIQKARNSFIHSHKPDSQHITSDEETFTKMATVWDKVSKKAKTVFGESVIKAARPSKTYSDKELREIQEEEVKKLIGNYKKSFMGGGDGSFYPSARSSISNGTTYFSLGGRKICPRCSGRAFGPRKDLNPYLSQAYVTESFGTPEVYKCEECGLELTYNQYQIAKKIRGEATDDNWGNYDSMTD